MIHELIVNSTNTSKYYYNNDESNKSNFSFHVDQTGLKNEDAFIKQSKKTILTSFQGSWDSLFSKSEDAEAIDFHDFLF